jgi:glycerol-3-phosphate acyltransferase PlsY
LRVTLYLIAALQAYLLGSIPWGFLAGRMQGVDLRTQGSGSTGATNALRILGKKWGYTVFALDALKGWLAVMLAFLIALKAYGAPQSVVITAGVVGAIVAGGAIGVSLAVTLRTMSSAERGAGPMRCCPPAQALAARAAASDTRSAMRRSVASTSGVSPRPIASRACV